MKRPWRWQAKQDPNSVPWEHATLPKEDTEPVAEKDESEMIQGQSDELDESKDVSTESDDTEEIDKNEVQNKV